MDDDDDDDSYEMSKKSRELYTMQLTHTRNLLGKTKEHTLHY